MATYRNRGLWILLLALACSLSVSAQVNNNRSSFNQRRIKALKQFEDHRKQALMNYAEHVKDAWSEFQGEAPIEIPKQEKVLPVICVDDSVATESWFGNQFNKVKALFKKNKKPQSEQRQVKPIKDKGEALSKGEVIPSQPVIPQPQPIAVVKENENVVNDYQSFTLYGNTYRVRIGNNCHPVLKSLDPFDVSEALKTFTQPQYDNLLYDCLQERQKYSLSDWAYYQMLQALVEKFYGKENNEGSLVLAFLYAQSGYKMRLAHDKTHLFMLASSRHIISGKSYISSRDDKYYLLDGRSLQGKALFLCDVSFPKESSMSLLMSKDQSFSQNIAPVRTITSIENPAFSFTVTSNKNYIDFYNTYPRSIINNNFMTKWVMYAETPIEKGVRDQLYPPMREKLKDMSQSEAVQQLLWWVQTGFEYEYDDSIWHEDRPFFGEESLYYPYCDCEDRAILFSHLVREIAGLDVCLVYYTGHLATAVAFTEEVAGDYFEHDGRKFTVCDPTIIPGMIGQTMEDYVDAPATLMLLRRQ